MIPHFPTFKKLEISDKEDVDSHTGSFPPYSDFEFSSLWSWDVKEEMAISLLNNNLVVRFTDYTTGHPFLSFLGTERVDETVEELLAYSARELDRQDLQLIPEVTADLISRDIYHTEESRDHFDYICDVTQHIEYPGKKRKAHRTLLRQFHEAYPEFERISLDLTSERVRKEVSDIYKRWDRDRGFITMSEGFAYERFLDSIENLSYTAVGLRVAGIVVAFHIASLPPGTCADALFSKADVAYRGAYPTLDFAVAHDLLERGYTHMNIQQDLGIEGLRRAKESMCPAYYLKKYSVRERMIPLAT